MPYHYLKDHATASGSRNAFVNTMFYLGLLGRYVTDWTGPEGDLRSMTLQMHDQLCPGDVASVNGRVGKRRPDGSGFVLELELTVTNDRGITATSTTTAVVPQNPGGDVPPRSLPPPPAIATHREIPEAARKQLGLQRCWTGANPVSESQIMSLCEMVRDANPLYAEGDTAREGRYGGMVAPPTSLLTWCQNRATQIGIDPEHPDVELPEQDAWPNPARGTGGFQMPETQEVVAVDVVAEFGAPIRPGDRISVVSELIDCTPLKTTRLGQGHFVTFRDEFLNQCEERVGRIRLTAFQYRSTGCNAAGAPAQSIRRIVPIPDDTSAPFWDAARRGELRIQRCCGCRRYQHPPVGLCPDCLSSDLVFEVVSGNGRLVAFTITHDARHPAYTAMQPYVVASVRLDEQDDLVLPTNLPGVPLESIAPEMRVRVVFEDVGGGHVLPQFTTP
jgi:uncharacterized OB-fold protein/acyl dehydratase